MLLQDHEFERIAAHAKAAFALHLDASKKQMVSRRLAPRLREIGLASFADYADLLDKDKTERASLTSTLSTNTTHFFREQHHFDAMKEHWFPDLIARARAGGRVRLWSAAASLGHEPYSLAMCVLDACPDAPNLDIQILATDIDERALNRAKRAEYTDEDIENVPDDWRGRFFQRRNGMHVCKDQVRNLVSFGRLNLPGSWPFSGKFDVIFCRNVAIYFDQPTQAKLWARLSDVLLSGGLLCIGHSERIARPEAIDLSAIGRTAYRKMG